MAKGHKSFPCKRSHNNYAQYLIQQRERTRGELYTTLQMCEDAAVIALNNDFEFGHDRAIAFINGFREVLNDIAKKSLEDDDKDIIYIRAKVDQRLQDILKQDFKPWDERYKFKG